MSQLSAAMNRRQRQQDQSQSNRRTWGDPLHKKNKNNIRIIFQNLNGFGYKKEDEPKTRGFYDLMAESTADIYAMAETNVDWRKVPKKKNIWDYRAS